jgi:intracellular septation protein
MQFFVDFLPVIIFFVAYKLSGIYVAVTATAVAACLTTGYSWLRHRRLQPMQIASLVIICIAAGLTLLFHDDAFIKWKPTLINGLFAVVFAGSLLTGRTLGERLFAEQFNAPRSVWRNITLAWTGFFIVCALANYYVAFVYQVHADDLNPDQRQNWHAITSDNDLYANLIQQTPFDDLSTEDQQKISEQSAAQRQQGYLNKIHQARWVDFKLFGLLALTIIFVVGQGFYIARYIGDGENDDAESDNNLSNIL